VDGASPQLNDDIGDLLRGLETRRAQISAPGGAASVDAVTDHEAVSTTNSGVFGLLLSVSPGFLPPFIDWS
jgi:hypothetical protein